MALQIWLPLTKDLRNQGLSNVTVTNNGATFNSAGKLGGCYSFGTSNSYITVDSTPLKTFTEFSFACWVKIISWNTSYSTVFAAKNGTSVGWTNLIFALLRNSSNSTLCFNIADGSSHTTTTNCQTGTLSLNTWYHIVCTYKSGEIKLYQDGDVVSTFKTTVVPNFNSIVNLWIGKSNANSYQSNNLLNDVRIYDHCLSPMEVKHISQGLVLHYPLDRQGWGQENLITQAMINAEPWKSAISGNYTIDGKTGWILSNSILYSKSGSGANNIFSGLTYEANTQYTISFKWRDDYRTDGKTSSLYIRFKYSDGTYTQVICPKCSYWKEEVMTSTAGKTVSAITTTYGNGGNLLFTDLKLERGTIKTPTSPIVDSDLYNSMGLDGTTEYDCSGYCNNGTRTGTFDWTSDTPKYSVSTYMPKAALITHSNPLGGVATEQEWTCAMWVKLDNTSQGNQQMNNFNYGNRIVHSANSYPLLYLNAGTNDYYNYGNKAVTAEVWTHVAFVFRNSDVTKLIYIDGVEQTNKNGPNKTSTPSGIPDTVTVGTNLAGYISDYRIYATALSADDVKSLYQNCATIDADGTIHGQIRS